MYCLNANYPPLDEVIKLWDLMLVFGVHLNVIFTTARIAMQRDDFLNDKLPNISQTLDYIDAEPLIALTIQLSRQISPSLFEDIVAHTREEPEASEQKQHLKDKSKRHSLELKRPSANAKKNVNFLSVGANSTKEV